jgi:hypothetical protein
VPERVVAGRGVPEVAVKAVVGLAGLGGVVQAVAPQLGDAQHGGHVLRPLVRTDDRRRLALPDEALQVAEGQQRLAELVVDEACPEEGVVEEGPEGVGPPVGDAKVGGEGSGVVAQRLDVLGDEVGREGTELRAAELLLERVRLVEARSSAALVCVSHQPTERGVRDAMLGVAPHEPLQVLPPLLVAALDAHRCGTERRLRGMLATFQRDGVEPRERLRALRAALGRLRGRPFGLLAVSLPHRRRHRPVVTSRRLLEAPGALRARGLRECELVRRASLGRAGGKYDQGDAGETGASEADHDVPWTALTRMAAARSTS